MGLGIACSETKRGLWCGQTEGSPPLGKASLLTYWTFSHLVLMNATFWSLGRRTTGHKNGKTHGIPKRSGGTDDRLRNASATCHMASLLKTPWQKGALGCCLGLCLWAPSGHGWSSATLTVRLSPLFSLCLLKGNLIIVFFQFQSSVYL